MKNKNYNINKKEFLRRNYLERKINEIKVYCNTKFYILLFFLFLFNFSFYSIFIFLFSFFLYSFFLNSVYISSLNIKREFNYRFLISVSINISSVHNVSFLFTFLNLPYFLLAHIKLSLDILE